MKNFTETPKNESITIYFGERHYEDKRNAIEFNDAWMAMKETRNG